ncbi:MAG: hypothetical protein ABIH11_02420 [Candidatus Altiarchaeota archaeon]
MPQEAQRNPGQPIGRIEKTFRSILEGDRHGLDEATRQIALKNLDIVSGEESEMYGIFRRIQDFRRNRKKLIKQGVKTREDMADESVDLVKFLVHSMQESAQRIAGDGPVEKKHLVASSRAVLKNQDEVAKRRVEEKRAQGIQADYYDELHAVSVDPNAQKYVVAASTVEARAEVERREDFDFAHSMTLLARSLDPVWFSRISGVRPAGGNILGFGGTDTSDSEDGTVKMERLKAAMAEREREFRRVDAELGIDLKRDFGVDPQSQQASMIFDAIERSPVFRNIISHQPEFTTAAALTLAYAYNNAIRTGVEPRRPEQDLARAA